MSRQHWTPVRVAVRASHLLTEDRTDARILDVGSGIGKFCAVSALATPSGSYTGVEQRLGFVEIARASARRLGIGFGRVRHVLGNAFDLDWGEFNGVYLFNPFFENLGQIPVHDPSVVVHPSLYNQYIEATQRKLEEMPPGTRVVTYWGFGGTLPSSYSCVLSEFCGRGTLESWVKNR